MPFFKTTDGAEIYYEIHGESGPAVILIHGLASSHTIWKKHVRHLKRKYRVLIFDFPGHGLSPKLPGYSFERINRILIEWMDHNHLDKAHIVGLSVGCSIALTFATEHPDRVLSLTMEGPTAGYMPWWNPMGWYDWFVFFVSPLILYLLVRCIGQLETARLLNRHTLRAGKKHLERLAKLQSTVDFKAVWQLLWASAYPAYVGHLSECSFPVSIIRGAQDPIPKRFVNYIRKRIPHVIYYEVPRTSHIVSLEQPKLYLQYLDACLLAPAPVPAGPLENTLAKGDQQAENNMAASA